MNRRFQMTVVATSACIVGLLLFGAARGTSATASDGPYTHLGVYSEVLSRIKADYVEEPDMKAVTSGAINGMLESLDPYASYLNADQYKQYLQSRNSKKAGVGLFLSKRFGYMSVVDALPGSPAAKAGLSTGDVVESINNISTRDMPLAFAEILLQGEAGTSVDVSVLRVRKNEPQKIALIRAALVYPPVAAHMESGASTGVGVISTITLDAARVKEIGAKISELEKQGAKRFILDLRHCSTGAPEEGVALANLFVDKGLLGYTQGQKISRQDLQAVATKAITRLPVAVLVNRGTAGAAEVAASAILESKRGEVVGEHTYGDAAIRKAITLDDGSAVILSVAKYYTPGGKAIQDTGVTPSVAVAETMLPSDSDDDSLPDVPDAPAPKTGADQILQKGIEVILKAPSN